MKCDTKTVQGNDTVSAEDTGTVLRGLQLTDSAGGSQFSDRKIPNMSECCCRYMLSHIWLFATPWTVACQVPLSMGFSRQEYWSVLPFPPLIHQNRAHLPKNWCFWTVVLKKTLESPLDCKEIQPVHSEGDQPWDFFGSNDAKAETPILWPPHVKSWLIGKDCDAGKDWGAGGEGDNRGWGGWMASPTQWTWVWVDSGSWWWTGRPGVLRFMGSQRVGQDLATELNWIKYRGKTSIYLVLSRYQVLLKYTLTIFISITPCMREVLSSPFYGLSTLKLRWKCLPQITSLERENMQTLDSKILFSTMKNWPRKLTFYIPKRH